MDAVDRGSAEVGLDPSLWVLGRHLAVGAGALLALFSLVRDASVPTAAMRGAGALVALLLTLRAGLWVLERALALDAAGANAEAETTTDPSEDPPPTEGHESPQP